MPPLAYAAPYDLALTYAIRKPRLARSLAAESLRQAIKAGRPDLAYKANSLLGAI